MKDAIQLYERGNAFPLPSARGHSNVYWRLCACVGQPIKSVIKCKDTYTYIYVTYK